LEDQQLVHGDQSGKSFAVSVRGLTKRYKDGTTANFDIDLDVCQGELLSIVGPNGAGKTTFLRQLTTELKPTCGTIEIFGVDAVNSPHQAKLMMGITPQEAGLFNSLTVQEHLEFFARLKRVPRHSTPAAVGEIIRSLDLEADAFKRVGVLSGGQRRGILVGLAFLGHPRLLVLDEPTTGLDPASRRLVWGVIRRALKDGMTVILSTHYMEEAERLSDRIAIIQKGRIIAVGRLENLLGHLKRSYKLSYRKPFETMGDTRVHYFGTFAEAQRHTVIKKLSEYQIARASLEDVYFTLTGEHFINREDQSIL